MMMCVWHATDNVICMYYCCIDLVNYSIIHRAATEKITRITITLEFR